MKILAIKFKKNLKTLILLKFKLIIDSLNPCLVRIKIIYNY